MQACRTQLPRPHASSWAAERRPATRLPGHTNEIACIQSSRRVGVLCFYGEMTSNVEMQSHPRRHKYFSFSDIKCAEHNAQQTYHHCLTTFLSVDITFWIAYPVSPKFASVTERRSASNRCISRVLKDCSEKDSRQRCLAARPMF
jgi:hypothetical protein